MRAPPGGPPLTHPPAGTSIAAEMRRILLLAVAFFALWSCGKGNDTLNNQNSVMNTKPVGYVAGSVINAVTQAPISGASVVVYGGGLMNQGTTDDKGNFSFGPIAAGAMFALRITADGMADAFIASLEIGDAAGNFPTDNGALYVGPVALIPSNGKFSVQVVSQSGAPVEKASVTIETLVRYLVAGVGEGTAAASSMSDVDGVANVTGLPEVRALPPHLADLSGVVVSVAPVDVDGDGKADLRGVTTMVSGADVRNSGIVPVVVLPFAGDAQLSIVASNVQKLATPASTAPSVLDAADPIRLVFSKPIDRMAVAVDLRDENGATMLMAPFVTGTLGNILVIMPMGGLEAGKEYNLAIRAGASQASRPDELSAAAPFFSKPNPNIAIVIGGRFHDVNGDGAWGNDGDQIELLASVPIGRPGLSPAFDARLWVDLDLNGSMAKGDAPGELPPAGAGYPAPLIVAAAEPDPGNGAGLSGYTRYFAPVPIALTEVRTPALGAVSFELRLEASDNGNQFVTDVSGRQAPARSMGALPLQ
jgi:carboxypeptidase family protein